MVQLNQTLHKRCFDLRLLGLVHSGSLIMLLKKGEWNFHTQETYIKTIYPNTNVFYFFFNIWYFSWKKGSIWFVLSRKSSIILLSIFVLSLLRQMFCPICQHKLKGSKIPSPPFLAGVYPPMCSLHILFLCHMCLSDDLEIYNCLVATLFDVALTFTSL